MSARAHDRDLKRLFALAGAVGAAFLPFFGLLLRTRGFTADRIGFVLAAASLAGVVAVPVWSHVADATLGGVRTLVVSSVVCALAAFALVPAEASFGAILVAAAALGAAQAPTTPLTDSIALTRLGDRIGDYGWIRLWASIGWAVAVLVFGAVFERFGLGPVPVVFGVGMLLYAAYVWRLPASRPDPALHPRSRLGSLGRAFRSAPSLVPYLAGLLVVSAAAQGAAAFVPLRIVGQGGGPFLVGLAACVAALIEVPLMRSSGSLGKRFGFRTLYAVGCAVSVAVMVGLALSRDPVLTAIARMASGVSFGLTYVSLVVMTERLVPPHLRNTGQALMQTVTMGIGPVIGAALGGLIYEHAGPPALFGGAAILVAAGVLIVWASVEETPTALEPAGR